MFMCHKTTKSDPSSLLELHAAFLNEAFWLVHFVCKKPQNFTIFPRTWNQMQIDKQIQWWI